MIAADDNALAKKIVHGCLSKHWIYLYKSLPLRNLLIQKKTFIQGIKVYVRNKCAIFLQSIFSFHFGVCLFQSSKNYNVTQSREYRILLVLCKCVFTKTWVMRSLFHLVHQCTWSICVTVLNLAMDWDIYFLDASKIQKSPR